MTWSAVGAWFKRWGALVLAGIAAILGFGWLWTSKKRVQDRLDTTEKRLEGAERSAERTETVATKIDESRKTADAEREAVEDRLREDLSEIASRPKPPTNDPVAVAAELKRRREKRGAP